MPDVDYPIAYQMRERQKHEQPYMPPHDPAQDAARRASTQAYEVAEAQRKLNDATLLVSRLEQTPIDLVSVPEARRAMRIIKCHNLTPTYVLKIYSDLDRPFVRGQSASKEHDPESRRLGLSAMLGIMVGYNMPSSLQVVDLARTRELKDVGTFVAREMAIVCAGSGAASGCAIAAAKGATTAAAKYGALKSGGVAVGKGASLMVGSGVFAALAAAVGVGCIVMTVSGTEKNAADHWELFEATWNKDRRILEAIKEGRDPQRNRCPAQERPVV